MINTYLQIYIDKMRSLSHYKYMMTWKTQYTEGFETLEGATQVLEALRTMEGFEGGRILDHTHAVEGNYLVQAIFADGEVDMIGFRRVLCPASFLLMLGVN